MKIKRGSKRSKNLKKRDAKHVRVRNARTQEFDAFMKGASIRDGYLFC